MNGKADCIAAFYRRGRSQWGQCAQRRGHRCGGADESQGSRLVGASSYSLIRQADRNLLETYFYTAERFGIRQPDLYAAGLMTVFNSLTDIPLMGRAADDLRPGLRRHEHAGHVIYYRQTDDALLIVAILHRTMRPDLDPDAS